MKVKVGVGEIYILRLNRDQFRKMQLQGLWLRIEPATYTRYSVSLNHRLRPLYLSISGPRLRPQYL